MSVTTSADQAFVHNTVQGPGLTIERLYTTAGVHPYDEVTWERRDVVQTNWKSGEIVFEQRGVEFPDFWSVNASTIVTTKYFRGAVGTDQREYSLRQLLDRVVLTYVKAGKEHGYFRTPGDAEVFEHELTYMLLHQVFSFNSPVWFNVGTVSPQQVSACFILAVDDTMDSILNWYKEEGLIFKGGSGAGLNLSRIRSSKELLKSSGGTASGPVSFMRGADASAGTIKSGGATRRAAKMVVLDVDHPDIEEFIETKVREEDKIRVLRDAGYDMDLGGKDITSVQYQNANNSVRVSDLFMHAVENGEPFGLTARLDGRVIETVDAQGLFRTLTEAAWACADPGIQYDDTINDWHTNPETGRINASNPCSEYMSLDNSSCNLASLNLLTFLKDDDTFDAPRFARAVEFVITAMDISICFADFPTAAIGDTTRRYRQLGIGYANLGALLMATGLPYDSDAGRSFAAAISSLMTGTAYKRSAELAGIVGPYEGYARNIDGHKRVMRKHAAANDNVRTITSLDGDVLKVANKSWEDGLRIGEKNGWRNAQASVLAPTGTIGFMMDCDTTGIEPDFSLVKFKKLVGGGSMQIVNQTIPRALRRLGYADETIEAIVEYIGEHGHVIDAPGLKSEHYPVFDCAMGVRSITPMGHVRMMAAVQPFISGAISKTVNMPETATVDEVEEIYFQGWKLGLKALAIYRDNCKVGQPLSDAKAKKVDAIVDATAEAVAAALAGQPTRHRLPKSRPSVTTSFSVAGAEGYMTAGSYPDDGLGEVFLKLGKQGSTLAGVMDAFSIAISIALQYGVPLEAFVSKFVNMRFEPAGMTDDPDIRISQSIMDYIFRRLALDYLPYDKRAALGIFTADERAATVAATYGSSGPAADLDVAIDEAVEQEVAEITDTVPTPAAKSPSTAHSSAELLEEITGTASDAPLCMTCGIKMRPAGSCYVCEGCGSTSGCS
ncbi:MAG: vitamin B12-dependent ribonucleotide reductase [Actinomycetota bacterium]|nr:vitamin B12-dependent ribonucleotide reductase [Actinomycetota bacterium]